METSRIKPDYNTLLQSLSEENLDKNVNIVHETPDLLLNPNLNASKNTIRDIQANEKLRQLFKQLKDSEKLDEFKAKELFSKFEEEEFDLEKLQELLHKYASLGQDDKEMQKQKEHVETVLKHQTQEEEEQQLPNQQQLPREEEEEEIPQAPHHNPSKLMHRGPHHSMVLESDVKEKIDVEPHYLHPAVAGQEISYHDNVLVDKAKKKDF